MSSRTLRSRTRPMKRNLVSPSLTSVFSSNTQASKSSSGSNSTVTQESVLWGKHRSSKSGVVKKTAKKSGKKETSRGASEEGGRPDVFAFMENDGEEGAVAEDFESDSDAGDLEDLGSMDLPPTSLPVAPRPPVSSALPVVSEGYEQTISARPLSFASVHSDSGISIRSSSPERLSPAMTQKQLKKPPTERSTVRSKPMVRGGSSSSIASSSSNARSAQHQWNGIPESFYVRLPKSEAPPTRNADASKKAPAQRGETGKKVFKVKISKSALKATEKEKVEQKLEQEKPGEKWDQDKAGYDLLSSSISAADEEAPKPLYRRFEALNNRILLVMQDEIMTMENDLAVMDQRLAEIERLGPTSRRAELQAPTPLQWQRMQLCGLLIQKLNTYNRTLASYDALARLSPTSEEEVQEYKEFLAKHHPLVASETAFLERLGDLATVTGKSGDRAVADKSTLTAVSAVLITVIVFKLMPSLLARMTIGSIVVMGMVRAGLLPDRIGDEGQWWGQKTIVYAAAIFVLTLAVG